MRAVFNDLAALEIAGKARVGQESFKQCVRTVARADQIIQPYEFGEDASKATCLWLKGLPPLRPTRRVPGRIVTRNGKKVERWGNQTDSGQNRLPPSADRWKQRARTYQGWADAFADQWGIIC